MKILLCTDRLGYGGAETHVVTLARELQARGHLVDVAAAEGELELPSGVRLIPLPRRGRGRLGVLRQWRRLRRCIGRGGYDVVHAHTRTTAAGAAAAARKSGGLFVVTAHAYFNMRGWRRRLSVWGQRTIAVSQDIREHLIRHGVSPSRVSVIHNGIDTARFSPPSRPSKGHRIVFVSRLDEDCALMATLLCRLAGRLVERYFDVKIIIVGGGSAQGRISALAELMNAACGSRIIQITGARRDIETILKGADLLVGVSRAAMEGAACGLPVILGGDEGYGGVFDPSGLVGADSSNLCCRGCRAADEERLLEDVVRIFGMSAQERLALGERGRRYVERYHSAAAMAEATEAVYLRARSVK